MPQIARGLIDPAFIPHGYCLSWNPGLVGLHVLSDSAIAISYFSIPVALLWFALHRKERTHNGVLFLFAAFIVACGLTHVMAVVTLWQPAYWADGLVKAVTAALSVVTAAALWPLMPRALAQPTAAALQREVSERSVVESNLREANSALEAYQGRLQAEIDERRAGEQRSQQLFELAPHAMVIADGSGRIRQVNTQLLNWFGYTREEVLGQQVELLIPERFRQQHPAFRQGYGEAPAVRPMGTGRALFARRKDGSEFPVDISLSAIHDPDGMQVIAAIADMTDRRKVEAALQHTNQALALLNGQLEESQRRLQAEVAERRLAEEQAQLVFELSPHGKLIADASGTILQVNAQLLAWFGYTREEVVGQPVELLMPERFRGHHPALRAGYAAAPGTRPMGKARSLFARRKDGSEFPADISLSAIHGATGMQVIAAIADMTAHVEAAEALREANNSLELLNKELETFAYSASHDLRQPVRAMTGFTHILLEDHGPKLDAEARDMLQRIQRAGVRMGQLIDALLDLSRISRGDLRRQHVDLSALAAEIAAELAQADPARTVQVDVQPGLEAEADPRLARVLLGNLLGNAWKFTGKTEGARVAFGAEPATQGTAYFVRDNGAGFEMAYAERLFGAFQRLHSPEEYPGTGIGLATAQRIVRRHGGSIWADGAPGRGATFHFTL